MYENELNEMALVVKEDGERQFPVRTYQNRNLRDLDFPHIDEAPSEGTSSDRVASLLPYFTKTTKYCTTAVLEESVIDNESLKQTAFLKAFDPHFVDELFKVEGCTRAIVHLPDMEISHQGDKADSLVVIVHGQVDVFVDGVFQQRLTDGDYFGEREFLGASDERASTAICVTFCDARVMYKSSLMRTLDRCQAMKQDYPYMLGVWDRKSERDALRFMKVFTERCMDCMDTPDGKEVSTDPLDGTFRSRNATSGKESSGQRSSFVRSGTGAVNSTGSNSARRAGSEKSPTSSSARKGASAPGSPMRKIGQR